jgi:hypothetical protein
MKAQELQIVGWTLTEEHHLTKLNMGIKEEP